MERDQAVEIKIIDEVREITSRAVSKKQDAAKLNYPHLIEKIKTSAQSGESFCYIGISSMNEFDKKLLEQDGFVVSLIDLDIKDYERSLAQYIPSTPKKQWKIKW